MRKPCAVARCTQPKPPGGGRQYCAAHQAEAREKRRRDSARRTKAWSEANPEWHRQLIRTRLYGISRDDFLQMVDYQDGRCAICREWLGVKLHIDHDHSSGKVRGLLCQPCNHLLGRARDSIRILDAAASYLAHPIVEQFADQYVVAWS